MHPIALRPEVMHVLCLMLPTFSSGNEKHSELGALQGQPNLQVWCLRNWHRIPPHCGRPDLANGIGRTGHDR